MMLGGVVPFATHLPRCPLSMAVTAVRIPDVSAIAAWRSSDPWPITGENIVRVIYVIAVEVENFGLPTDRTRAPQSRSALIPTGEKLGVRS